MVPGSTDHAAIRSDLPWPERSPSALPDGPHLDLGVFVVSAVP